MSTQVGEVLVFVLGVVAVVFIVYMKWRDASAESDSDDREPPPDLPLWR